MITTLKFYSPTIIKLLPQVELIEIKENSLKLVSRPIIQEIKYCNKLHNIKSIILDFLLT